MNVVVLASQLSYELRIFCIMGYHAGALIVIHKSQATNVGWVERQRNEVAERSTHHFGRSVGFRFAPTHPTKNHLNQLLKYLCITMRPVRGNQQKKRLSILLPIVASYPRNVRK